MFWCHGRPQRKRRRNIFATEPGQTARGIMSMVGATRRNTNHSDFIVNKGELVRDATNSFRRFGLNRLESVALTALPLVAAAPLGAEGRRRSMQHAHPPVSPVKGPAATVFPTQLQRAGATNVGNTYGNVSRQQAHQHHDHQPQQPHQDRGSAQPHQTPQRVPASREPVTNARRASREALARTANWNTTPIKKRGLVGVDPANPIAVASPTQVASSTRLHAHGPPTKHGGASTFSLDKSPVKEQLTSLLGALATVLTVAQRGSLGQVHPNMSPRRSSTNGMGESSRR